MWHRAPVGVLAFTLAACAGEAPSPVYPGYTPAEAALFDNSIDPAALNAASGAPRKTDWDAKLIERTQRADAVVQALIVTVERHAEAGYTVAARVEGRLAGRPPSSEVDVSLAAGSDEARRLDHGAKLVGKRMVLFLRTHASPDGPVVHFRAEPSSPEVLEAIRKAAKMLDGADN